MLFIPQVRYKFQRDMIMAGELSLRSDMRLTKAVVAAAHQQRRRQQSQHTTKTITIKAHVFEAQY
jgi:hypothetical protein